MNRFAKIEKRTRTAKQRRAQRLSLRTPTHPRFVPEGLPGDPRRSPAVTQIGCLTTRVLLTTPRHSPMHRRARTQFAAVIIFVRKILGKVKQKWILSEEIHSSKGFIGSLESIFFISVPLHLEDQDLYEILENVVALWLRAPNALVEKFVEYVVLILKTVCPSDRWITK